MATCIQLRRSPASVWQTANPILANGEVGFETDTCRLKIGDGVAAWNALSYFEGAREKMPPKIVAANAVPLINDAVICEPGCSQVVLPVENAAVGLHHLSLLNRSDTAVTVRGDIVPFVRGANFTADAAAPLKYLEINPHRIANATKLTVSCWVYANAAMQNNVWVSTYAGTGLPFVELGTSDANANIVLTAFNASSVKIVELKYPYTRGQLNHVFITLDMAASTHACCINGAEVTSAASTLTAGGFLDFSQPTLYIAGHGNTTRQEMSGTLAQLWFAPGVHLPPAANLGKFYNAGPVDLGANGELPTGSRPAYFLNDTGTALARNLGASGGTFTVNNAARIGAGVGLPTEQIVGYPAGYTIPLVGSATFLRHDARPLAAKWHLWS